MKNKKFTYILIPLVILIWGLIIFKVIKHINHVQNPTIATSSFSKADRHESVQDTLSLILNYRDPFLHGIIRPTSTSRGTNNLLSNNGGLTTATKPSVNFPGTKYSGLVVNSKNKQKVGLLKIENKDYLAKEGELIAGGKIIKLYADSVIIIFNRAKKTFYKNK